MMIVDPVTVPDSAPSYAGRHFFTFQLPDDVESPVLRQSTKSPLSDNWLLYHMFDSRLSTGYFFRVGAQSGRGLVLCANKYRGYSFKNQPNRQFFPSIGAAFLDVESSVPVFMYSSTSRVEGLDVGWYNNGESYEHYKSTIEDQGATFIRPDAPPSTAWFGFWFAHRAALTPISIEADSCPNGPFLLPVVLNASALSHVVVASRFNFDSFPNLNINIADRTSSDLSFPYQVNPLSLPSEIRSDLVAVGLGSAEPYPSEFLAQAFPGGPVISSDSVAFISQE